ncbi:hypothetical protein F4X88_18910 [Candidatus Poribacteria bacterium]|nr:hypothetical protein [Candidatus Poribacteria bacterium]MYA58359.1 hypothetical protein [Candidatus Poribacteria bacterium]
MARLSVTVSVAVKLIGDTSFFLKGIRNVVEAQGGTAKIAKQTGIAPEALSKFLCSQDPLQLGTLSAILKALGWRLSIQPLTIEDHSADIPDTELTTADETLQTGSEQTAESHPA